MNHRRTMLLVFLACLGLGTFRAEWSYNVPETSFVMRVVVAVVPVATVLIAGFALGAFRIRWNTHRLWFACAGLVVLGAVQAVHVLFPSGYGAVLRPDFYLSLILTVAGAMIGYWFAADVRDLQWGLKKIALLLALLSVYGGLMRLIGADQIHPLLVPGFPIRLFILFAYCWYLHEWLNRSKWSLGPLLGLAACSPEVFITFHKPVLFCAVVASTFLFVYSIWVTHRVAAVAARTVALLTIGTSLFVTANLLASGQIVEHVTQVVTQRMLHESARQRGETSGEALARIAGNRLYLWKEGLATFQASPLVGVGFGQQVGGMASNPQDPTGRGLRYSVYVHNGYLDLLLSVGILGTLPVAVALIWWLRVALRRELSRRMGYLVVPCLAFVVSILAYNLGGGSRLFFSLNAFTVFFMAAIVRLAEALPAAVPLSHRRYGWARRPALRGGIRHANARS